MKKKVTKRPPKRRKHVEPATIQTYFLGSDLESYLLNPKVTQSWTISNDGYMNIRLPYRFSPTKLQEAIKDANTEMKEMIVRSELNPLAKAVPMMSPYIYERVKDEREKELLRIAKEKAKETPHEKKYSEKEKRKIREIFNRHKKDGKRGWQENGFKEAKCWPAFSEKLTYSAFITIGRE